MTNKSAKINIRIFNCWKEHTLSNFEISLFSVFRFKDELLGISFGFQILGFILEINKERKISKWDH